MNPRKPPVCLITPALARVDSGNWQTAQRWARMLATDFEVRLARQWDGRDASVMLALHARRSADSIAAWAAQRPRRPLAVVLTGTDLYRDIHTDPRARRSLALADRLVVLHDRAPSDVPAAYRDKCVVCFQSCGARRPLDKTTRHLRALMVGNLRVEKSPATYFEAARRLAGRADIVFDHVGSPLDPALGRQARALAAVLPGYRWLGALPHRVTLARIQRAHVLVHPSAIEGGAHVVMEAVRSGTPVLASRISGNVGMLGRGYRGYFDCGDAQGLVRLLLRCRDDPAMLPALRAQCDERAPLFDPARERATLRRLLAGLLETPR